MLAGAICGPATAVAAPGAAPPAARCPAPRAEVTERLVSADCSACWAASGPDHPGPVARATSRRWTLDWIVPTTPEAPLAAAALPDARERAERAERIERGSLTPKVSARPAMPRLELQAGPGWHGYMAVRLILRGRPVPGQAWLALVEHLPAGSEGSTVSRDLVRSVAGPWPIDALRPSSPLDHLAALRWPEGTRPERLRARAWIEGPDGRILAMAADRCDAD